LLLIDAFTGDGFPVHLLTQEAIEIYVSRLTKAGLLMFHVSNRYYELRPVIKAIAGEMNLHGAINIPYAAVKPGPEQIATLCVVLSGDRQSLQPLLDAGWISLEADGLEKMSPWTDDYVNILEPLQEGIKRRYLAWKIVWPF
jgi:hypothetical protein